MTDTITYAELVDWARQKGLLKPDEKPTPVDLRMILRQFRYSLEVSVGYLDSQPK